MGKMTFVVEFDEGKEPPVNAGMDVCGGRLVAVSWSDYRDDLFSTEQRNHIEEALAEAEWHDEINGDDVSRIMDKVDLLTS